MRVIEAENVNTALGLALPYLLSEGIAENSRNGTVLVAPGPVMTIYRNPTQRVLFSPLRDANPFFHLMESLWMLAGRNDVYFPMYFNKRFKEYSDNGHNVHGAYGWRWRSFFGFDQLKKLIEELKENPNSRRAVLQMWSADGDLVPIDNPLYGELGGLKGKDVPCNTHAYFDLRNGKLNMTVCNRSNDVIWGAYGANAVHFSVLQEYMAHKIGAEVGVYRQYSNNFHVYTDVYPKEALEKLAEESFYSNYYEYPVSVKDTQPVTALPLMLDSLDGQMWDMDLKKFMEDPLKNVIYNDGFFNHVAVPMVRAYSERKQKIGNGLKYVDEIVSPDWRLACTQWIARREKGN